jgi:hypothetical protein
MDPIDAVVERRIKEAMDCGEFEQGALKGKPLPDIDTPRKPGWWTEQFVQRERERLREERDQDDV